MKNILSKFLLSLKVKGFWRTLAVSLKFIINLPKNLVMVHIPLTFMKLFSCQGLIIKNVQESKMLLDLNDLGLSRDLALKGIREKNSTEQIKRELRQGMTVVEIGANIGYYLLIEAKIIGRHGCIYAFEPVSSNISLLKSNIELNGYGPITEVNQLAVGDENQKINFFVSNRSNLGSFIKREGYTDQGVVEVDMVRLDDFLKNKNIDYVRMDIEGFEKQALLGMPDVLKSAKGLFIEIHSELLAKNNSSTKEILEILSDYEVVKAFWRGRRDTVANSRDELINHSLREKGYWESFFTKINKDI